jgi:NDP-sugar pyrophosphorylase family protein
MNIVITLAGHSRRFKEAGYKTPKFLIEIDGKPMIDHVVEMFNLNNDRFYFVFNEIQNNEYPELADNLRKLVKWCKIVVIPEHELGPVHTAMFLTDIIEDDEPVIISYCDMFVEWNYSNFKNEIIGYDAAIPCFVGFQPASYGTTKYAYVRVDENMQMLELREKECFTDNRVDEYASVGIYYFKTWKLFNETALELMRVGFGNLKEGYVSLLSNLLVAKGLSIKITNVEKFICWGTPEDLSLYQFWSQYFLKNQFKEVSKSSSLKIQESQINVVPMAGKGSRFKKDYYNVSKPLILIGKEPMFLKASNSFPSVDKWVFLFRADNLKKHTVLKSLVKDNFNNPNIISVDFETSGQAATCLLAKEQIIDRGPLFIASCDYITIYDSDKWESLIENTEVDVVIWTYRMGSMLTKNPKAFAYCKVGEDGITVVEIVEKDIISVIAGVCV